MHIEFVSKLLDRPILLHPAFRVLLAIPVILGGLAFVALGLVSLYSGRATFLPALLIGALGVGFVFVGVRLASRSAASSNVFGPVARRVCGLVVGGLALGVAFHSWQAQDSSSAESAVFAGFMAYWLLRPHERSRSERGDRVA